VLLNGRIASIPSMRVRPGDTVTLQDRSFGMPLVIESLAEPPLARPEWLSYDEIARHARVTRVPLADEVPFPIDVQQVVEYYANRI
jgi:small subunit ribosomal protein S4